MGLLPEIDEKKTQDKVRHYLEKEFPRLVLQAGYSMLEVQSPKFDITGGSGANVRNSLEDKIIDHFKARPEVFATVKAIRRCPEPYKQILIDLYVKDLQGVDVQEIMGYGHAQFNILKKRSLLYFADSFQNHHDFHEYKDDDIIKTWKNYV